LIALTHLNFGVVSSHIFSYLLWKKTKKEKTEENSYHYFSFVAFYNQKEKTLLCNHEDIVACCFCGCLAGNFGGGL